jgi:hypothetical protein
MVCSSIQDERLVRWAFFEQPAKTIRIDRDCVMTPQQNCVAFDYITPLLDGTYGNALIPDAPGGTMIAVGLDSSKYGFPAKPIA